MRTPERRFFIRAQRVRNKIKKNVERLRLSIFKSNMHIHAQIIDDSNSVTLVSASTLEKNIRRLNQSNCNIEQAKKLGDLLAIRASDKGLSNLVFDKSGYKYHGVVKAFAEAVRQKITF